MLQKPMLVTAFYILFFMVIIYIRLDFSITKNLSAEARMKMACITEQVLTLGNKRVGPCHHFDENVNGYKQSQDVSTLNSGKKRPETEHKALTSETVLLQSRLKIEGSDLCNKVNKMQTGGTGQGAGAEVSSESRVGSGWEWNYELHSERRNEGVSGT